MRKRSRPGYAYFSRTGQPDQRMLFFVMGTLLLVSVGFAIN